MADFNLKSLLDVLQAFELAPKKDAQAAKVLRENIPALKAVVTAGQQLDAIAAEGRKVLAQTAAILGGVSHSTATASNEIFEILQRIVYSEKDVVLTGSPQEIRDQLMDVMNALQFQDIVSQQITAIQTLLETFDQTLAPLAGAPDESELAVHLEGAFDATASFDRDRVEVDDLDAWINQAKEDEDKT